MGQEAGRMTVGGARADGASSSFVPITLLSSTRAKLRPRGRKRTGGKQEGRQVRGG